MIKCKYIHKGVLQMIKSLDKFIQIEKRMEIAFFIMIVIDVIMYITRFIFYATDTTIHYFDDLTEIMRNGFLILAFLYVLLIINYKRYFVSETKLNGTRYIVMIFIILGYILISFLVFILTGLIFIG